jgi:hypothetical protein
MRRLLLDLRRRAQSATIRTIRKSRFFPRTVVNRLGEDEQLGSSRTDAEVLVYFPGALDTLYQIEPWLPTFEAVHAAHPLVIVCQDSRVAARLRSLTPAPVLTIARYAALDGLLSRSDVRLALYVSHLPRNFECLRFASLLHAYIGHGDSDKGVSASNQLKAYDYVFAPGQAAVDRIAARLMRFRADEHCVIVGQPLTLSAPPLPPAPHRPGERAVVLYAPTWEGAQPSVAYSSVLTHGERLVDAVLADPRFTLVYRPHPLIGVNNRLYAGADHGMREAIARAAETDPAAGHRVVEASDEDLETSFERAHLIICDISAVATAWLPSLKPMVVTQPAGTDAVSADSGMLRVVPRLPVAEIAQFPALMQEQLDVDPSRQQREELVAYYLSPYWPDGVLERFVTVCGELIAERNELRGRLVAAGATGT